MKKSLLQQSIWRILPRSPAHMVPVVGRVSTNPATHWHAEYHDITSRETQTKRLYSSISDPIPPFGYPQTVSKMSKELIPESSVYTASDAFFDALAEVGDELYTTKCILY
jgi:hypothetical protein